MRTNRDGASESDGIGHLLRETADGLGHLIAEHVNLAKLELVTDLKQQARRLTPLVFVVPALVFAYVMAWLGVAATLAHVIGLASALFAVAGLHALVGVVAAAVLVHRVRRRVHLMDETAHEVSRTLSVLKASSSASAQRPAPVAPSSVTMTHARGANGGRSASRPEPRPEPRR